MPDCHPGPWAQRSYFIVCMTKPWAKTVQHALPLPHNLIIHQFEGRENIRGVKAQICPKPLSNGISYQCSTGHLHVPSLARCPPQIKNFFFSLLPMALIFSWFPIMVSANKISPHHMSYWLFFQRHGFQTSPAGMKTNIHKPSEGVQRNKGQGVLELQSEAHDLSSPPIFCAYRKLYKELWGPTSTFPVRPSHCKEHRPTQVASGKGMYWTWKRKAAENKEGSRAWVHHPPSPQRL